MADELANQNSNLLNLKFSQPTSNNRIFIFVSKILNSFDSKLDNGIADGIPVLFQVPRSIVIRFQSL
jgi:hypothetical protein